MTVDALLNEAGKLNWAGYSEESGSPAAQNSGPVAQNTGIAAVGPGPGAQNTGIAAVGPGPGVSPGMTSAAIGKDVDALASVQGLLSARS